MAPKHKRPAAHGQKTSSRAAGSRKRKSQAVLAESDSDDSDELDIGGDTSKVPPFGATWMLFRVLMLSGVAVSFAAAKGDLQTVLVAAATTGALWHRCGLDGKNGTLHKWHLPDSRAHQYGREQGFRAPNQAEIDADPRSAAVYASLRTEVKIEKLAAFYEDTKSSENVVVCEFPSLAGPPSYLDVCAVRFGLAQTWTLGNFADW